MQTFQLLVFFVLPSSSFDELRFLCQISLGKGVFSLQFSPLVPVVIVIRYIIPKGIAGPLFIVELHIVLNRVDEFFPASARIEFEVDEQFLFNPPVQGFINRIVRWLSRPRHGSGDTGSTSPVCASALDNPSRPCVSYCFIHFLNTPSDMPLASQKSESFVSGFDRYLLIRNSFCKGSKCFPIVASFLVVAAPRVPLCPPWSFRSNLWSSQKLHDNLHSKYTLGIDIFLPFRVHFYFSIKGKKLFDDFRQTCKSKVQIWKVDCIIKLNNKIKNP